MRIATVLSALLGVLGLVLVLVALAIGGVISKTDAPNDGNRALIGLLVLSAVVAWSAAVVNLGLARIDTHR